MPESHHLHIEKPPDAQIQRLGMGEMAWMDNSICGRIGYSDGNNLERRSKHPVVYGCGIGNHRYNDK